MFSIIILLSIQYTFSQNQLTGNFSTTSIELENPSSIEENYTYDPVSDRYFFNQSVGDFNINYPIILSPKEYEELILNENLKKYYKDKINAAEGRLDGSEDLQKNLIPEIYVNSKLFESIFGGNTIEVVPQGSLEIDLGVLYTKQDNPSFSPRNRSNFSFDFDQRIGLSLLGKVGTRVQVNANFDTQSTFDFQNLMQIQYEPSEDDIIKKIEVGNVSMPLNSSLISGAQSLFGFKTELQFGKTRVTAVFSEQKSEAKTVVAQAGGTIEEFEFRALDYDENRHFFLSHAFREKFDQALLNYPFINSNIQITRTEVWVTNRNNNIENIRNIVAFQDLGESSSLASAVNVFAGPNANPDNSNNGFNPLIIGQSNSQLTNSVRDIATIQSGILLPNVNEGFDYGKLENARKLNVGSDYSVNSQLGYISLNQKLDNDEILAVAFQYTIGDQVYQVGEFANDGVQATEILDNNDSNPTVNNNNLIVKLLKSTVSSVDAPMWKLMMKNIYNTGSFQLEEEGFKLNIFYNESSALNYIIPVDGVPFPTNNTNDLNLSETPLLNLFNFDRLNSNNDPQFGGDGFFDFVPGITVLQNNGKIIFTKVEPFGEFLFEKLRLSPNENYDGNQDLTDDYNLNQKKYVYSTLYKSSKTIALQDSEKNKFQITGKYKSSSGSGIPIGAYNVPRGSVNVTAGGRVLTEGVDYTVNYQLGTVQILDPALQSSGTPINVSVENNATFGQQTKRFTGFNVEHQFNENFLLGGTFLNLNERPVTQKANYGTEPINNTIFGFNGNFATEIPVFTRLINKLPNIETEAPSNLSIRGEVAYLVPGAPKGTDFKGEVTSYVDDFEGTQNIIDLMSPQGWSLSSRPKNLGLFYNDGDEDNNGIQNGYDRALLNWYSIDPVFYSSLRPTDINDDDISSPYTRRIFIDEIFPQIDIVQGQLSVINSLDLNYYPDVRGPYNMNPENSDNSLADPLNSWAGITRQITTTDFEQSNVEYIEFWLQDPFINNSDNLGGKLTFNLGNISEDILKDGRKQYENGLPEDGDISLLNQTTWGSIVPQNQSLIYAFSTLGQERENQDVGLDGYDDQEEIARFPSFATLEDPSNDNYNYFLNGEGSILNRYRQYNGLEGNSPETFTNTNRGSTTQPDTEDINRDNTMNTIDSYFEYEISITPNSLSDINNEFIKDRKEKTVSLPNGTTETIKWYQFRVPVNEPTNTIGGISDFRSIRFIRMYLNEFIENTTFRFGTLELVRSDWRKYQLSLDEELNNDNDITSLNIGVIGIQENEESYVSPPGVEREQFNNNNTIVRQNEQSLVLDVCALETEDSRAVYKNINVDMRQYKRIRMFLHAEEGASPGLSDGDIVAFIRMGNDLSQNYYQIEVPLQRSSTNTLDPQSIWPEINEINLPMEVLESIKSLGITNGTLANEDPIFYDVFGDNLIVDPVNEFSEYQMGQHRVSIKGNPNFGDIRTLMVGVKNPRQDNMDVCGTVWFNELRLSDMDNEGGWAATVTLDTNIADFMSLSATGRQSTSGFGSIEQGPNERDIEDIRQYDLVSNINVGQLLPEKWGVTIPFNFGLSEELITPEYDQQYKDIKLQSRLNSTQNSIDKNKILEQSEDYTKRKSINFIGINKQKTGEGKSSFYDLENLTLNYSYNKIEHRDYEIEDLLDQNIRAGATYNFNFNSIKLEPFKKNDSLFTGKYFKILKDINFNLLPTNISINTDFTRQFNKQKFRESELTGDNITVNELFRRNYNFDLQYNFNYVLSDGLNFSYNASNNNIVKNYFIDDNINGAQDSNLDVFDRFFDIGDPNRQSQQFAINYELPLNKIPTFSFLRASYSYTGDFQWQKGSDLFGNLTLNGETYDLGNTISNANTHNINSSLDMLKFYRYIGLVKNNNRNSSDKNPFGTQRSSPTNNKFNFKNTVIDLLTSVKRIQINYSENNGSFLPGYLQTPDFIGSFKPSLGYVFGSQRDIRYLAARNGWLTVFPNFNQQYTEVTNKNLTFSANLTPVRDLKIDLTAGRTYSENLTENFNTIDEDGDGISDDYNPLIQNTLGNFNISTVLIKTAFSNSDENSSETFDTFRENRLVIARRLALNAGIDFANPNNFENGDLSGFPLGYGKTNQSVLLPAFLSAYSGKDPSTSNMSAFRNVPIPNWTLKYTGLMKLKWFKKHFKRLSISHGYNAMYTINQFRSNLDFNPGNPDLDFSSQNSNVLDQSDNYKNEFLYSNINLMEQFSPLFKLDFEMKNSVKILAEVKKDRLLSLSFDNNLLTEIQGNEYIFGFGYRFQDLKIRSSLGGTSQIIKSDLNMKLDLSIRNNKTIIRYLDLDNNQVTSGQTIWNFKYSADYDFSRNLTGIFYFDYSFSEYAISTAFPQTTIRSGFTMRYNFGN
ncbi:cell surface protein SprA [Flavobacteriaceae bacterium]|nr:cell surface protein SprA [Flavobacteriaceae bacterium]MDC1492839.1 cell surface protein SprA [Flavobacteriaceae bacterium]